MPSLWPPSSLARASPREARHGFAHPIETIAAEGADIERRVVDSIMGALMAGRISATLANRSGTALATRRGETITAHQFLNA